MGWFTRFTRFGDVHLVYGQERGMSCGPSSVAMCVAKINKLSRAEAFIPEQRVRALYANSEGTTAEFLTHGASGAGLANTLNMLNCGRWTCEIGSPVEVVRRMVATVGVSSALTGPTVSVRPVILGVLWKGGGGHAVVVDTIREFRGKRYATVCDPWDANVHVQEIDELGFHYRAQKVRYSWDGPGKSVHKSLDAGGGVLTETRKRFDYDQPGEGLASVIIFPS